MKTLQIVYLAGEMLELHKLGLAREEIEGYIEFFKLDRQGE